MSVFEDESKGGLRIWPIHVNVQSNLIPHLTVRRLRVQTQTLPLIGRVALSKSLYLSQCSFPHL